MITVNTNGNPISSGFISAIREDSPSTMGRLWYNGAELECDIVSVTVEKGSCGSDPFMIGEVVGDSLTAIVKNLNESIKGEKIEFHVGFLVNGDYEYVSFGQFKVSEVMKTRYQSTIVAYSGVVADSTKDFNSAGLTNVQLIDLATRLQSDMGCTITFDSGIDTSLGVNVQFEGLTDYQILQILAICCGGYIVNTIDGNIVVKRYNATPTLDVDTGMMVNLPEIAENPYKVRNIGVLVSEATTDNRGRPVEEVYYTLNAQEYIKVIKQGTEYYLEDENGNRIIANARPELADLYFKCIYMTQNMFEENIVPVVGYEYYPATIQLTLGDPRLEGSDVLSVEDVDGTLYAVPCHKIIHKYSGGFTTVVQSAEASDEANDIGTALPVTQRLQSMDRQVGKAQATADNAYQIADDTAQYFWFIGEGDDTGAHITEIPQEQWSDPESEYYHSGGNLLARSNGVAVRKGMKEVASFGERAIIGAVDETHLELDSDSIQGYSSLGKVLDIGLSGVSLPVQKSVNLGDEYVYDVEAGQSVSHEIIEISEHISSGTFKIRFYLEIGTTNTRASYSFTYGTPSAILGIISYDGSDVISVSSPIYDAEVTAEWLFYEVVEDAPTWTLGTRNLEDTEGGYSYAEGSGVEASGNYSHAQNCGTVADQPYQTAIGRYNTPNNTNNLFAIGYGTSSNPSDVFTVDLLGNVNAVGKYKIGGVDLSASDVGALSVNDKYIRSSAGDLAWTGSDDGDAKVIMKSALAYWNGAYSGAGSNLKYGSGGRLVRTGSNNLSSSGTNHSYSINANSTQNQSFTVQRAGYYPLSIDRINLGGTGSDKICLNKYGITARSDGEVTYEVAYYNPTATNYTNITVAVYVLWQKLD